MYFHVIKPKIKIHFYVTKPKIKVLDTWKPMPSGLLGPVTIKELKRNINK